MTFRGSCVVFHPPPPPPPDPWALWLDANRDRIERGSPYQWAFARDVLARVGLDSRCVWAEFSVEHDGETRRVDFAIIRAGLPRLAVEIDGFDKTGTGSGWTTAEFEDFLQRQNFLIRLGWQVIRFPNVAVRDRPDECRAELLRALLAADARPPVRRPSWPPRAEDVCPEHREPVVEVLKLDSLPFHGNPVHRSGKVFTTDELVPVSWYCHSCWLRASDRAAVLRSPLPEPVTRVYELEPPQCDDAGGVRADFF
ncbi:MAG: endonuclease domain-containing protein [Actinobacteria bacterium]|nr:endonuclease domain-containing protein [Actinomycetota bacterium]